MTESVYSYLSGSLILGSKISDTFLFLFSLEMIIDLTGSFFHEYELSGEVSVCRFEYYDFEVFGLEVLDLYCVNLIGSLLSMLIEQVWQILFFTKLGLSLTNIFSRSEQLVQWYLLHITHTTPLYKRLRFLLQLEQNKDWWLPINNL